MIGLEIHAELKTDSKMFSGSKNDPFNASENTNINPIDLAHPGTLPTINKKAVESMIKIGLACNGEIANFTEFDRKNYFYPDIPKGYQISQYQYPIVSGGEVGGVELTRIHLEEDTGTNKHDQGNFSLVDYNRAGVPLMELVTEPVIKTAEQAGNFGRELQMLLRYLGVSDANMEKGEMRVEVNISISPVEGEFGTKVEVKNINSFRAAEKAIDYEIERMTALYEAGREDEIVQETRGWDDAKSATFSQRKKESAHDYRYFPEPDLPKLYLHEMFDLEALKDSLPELPSERRARFIEDGLENDEQRDVLLANQDFATLYDAVTEGEDKKFKKLTANYITSDIVSLLQEEATSIPEVEHMKKLIQMITANEISSRGAKDILAILVKESSDPQAIAEEKGLIQKNDAGELEAVMQKIIDENPGVVEEYKGGKESTIQFFVGQGMKATQGSANPGMLLEIAKKLLN